MRAVNIFEMRGRTFKGNKVVVVKRREREDNVVYRHISFAEQTEARLVTFHHRVLEVNVLDIRAEIFNRSIAVLAEHSVRVGNVPKSGEIVARIYVEKLRKARGIGIDTRRFNEKSDSCVFGNRKKLFNKRIYSFVHVMGVGSLNSRADTNVRRAHFRRKSDTF